MRITETEQREIATMVVMALEEKNSAYCSQCQMMTKEHREAHEKIDHAIPQITALEEWLNNVNGIKWSVVKFLAIVATIAMLALAGIKVGGVS